MIKLNKNQQAILNHITLQGTTVMIMSSNVDRSLYGGWIGLCFNKSEGLWATTGQWPYRNLANALHVIERLSRIMQSEVYLFESRSKLTDWMKSNLEPIFDIH